MREPQILCLVELDSSSGKIAGSQVAALCIIMFELGFIDPAVPPLVQRLRDAEGRKLIFGNIAMASGCCC